MKPREFVLANEKEVLAFLKSRFPMYHLSNFFFRDIQYGIREMFERRGTKLNYTEAEEIAREFARELERKKIFTRINDFSWVVNYPEYKTIAARPAAPAKPAPSAPPQQAAAARPAGGLPPLKHSRPAGSPAAGGLPPVKSASVAASPVPAAAPAPTARPAQSAPKPSGGPAPAVEPKPSVEPEKVQPKQPQPASTGGKPALPPIKSSKPIGGKS